MTYHVDTSGGEVGVDDNTFTRFRSCDEEFGALVLLSDEGGNVGFETTCSETHDHERNDEDSQ